MEEKWEAAVAVINCILMSYPYRYLAIILLCGLAHTGWAQDSLSAPLGAASPYRMAPNSSEITVDFLSSYFEQDGDRAAVTGGKGTEQLTDFSNALVVNVPLDSANALNVYAGADYYSSASTDNIDNFRSSASSSDTRAFATVSYRRKRLETGETFGLKAGISTEYDYQSYSAGASYAREWNRGNSEINVTAQAFFGDWSLIYPYELRGSTELTNSKRQSYNGQINFSQVLNKRMQLSLSAEVVKMSGLLSTPFHRVYFADGTVPDIERLPSSRLKIPLGLRFNYYPADNWVLRTYYRYYWDDFDITSHTFELETPVNISTFMTVSPFYRFHTQNGSSYFAPYQAHSVSNPFYTSDYDLSTFQSHKFGLTLRYAPVYGLLRSKKVAQINRAVIWKSVAVRIGSYRRSNGLNAYFASLSLEASIK